MAEWLRKYDFETCVIKDMPDINHVNPRQKIFTYGVLTRFIIVLDFGPSGHLNEIELLKDMTKPVVLISHNEKGASYMTHGLDFSHTYFKRFALEQHGTIENALKAGSEWANELIGITSKRNKATLPWLNKNDSE